MKIGNIILEKGKIDDVVIFYTEMRKMDKFAYQPTEDVDGRLYFIVDIKGDDVRFYQSGGYDNVFDEEWYTRSFIFTPEEEHLKNNELHIISDYD